MTLKCKQSDIAVVVTSKLGNEGKIVTCIRLANPGEILKCEDGVSRRLPLSLECPIWITDIPLIRESGSERVLAKFFPDYALHPLRDSDGQDETLAWAPVPKKVEA